MFQNFEGEFFSKNHASLFLFPPFLESFKRDGWQNISSNKKETQKEKRDVSPSLSYLHGITEGIIRSTF